MNPTDFIDEEDPKPPKPKRDRVDFVRSLNQRRLGFTNKNKYNDNFNMQAVAEDTLVSKEYKDMACDLPGLPRSTFLMVFSPDGTKAASTHGNHNIYITDIRTGRNIKVLVGHPRTPWCIAFHPTSNQILASGCLGGQVRIWDLSGGSEMWTTDSQTVIASIAFHPDDRVLVIATYNQLYFWDWSKPEPFMHIATASVKEKVRYVAFDKLGHKLITGISNDNVQSRWMRPSVSVPRRNADGNRFQLASSLLSVPNQPFGNSSNRETTSSTLSSVPERERRITACYRNLVHEYEQLVHRYLQIYRPPTMVDQGTDPMEMEETSSSTSSNSSNVRSSRVSPQPSTSRASNFGSPTSSRATAGSSPSREYEFPSPLRRRPNTFIQGTQTMEPNDEIFTSITRTANMSSLHAPRYRIARVPIVGLNIQYDEGTYADDFRDNEPFYRIISTVTVSRLNRTHTFSLLERTDITETSDPLTPEELSVIRTAIASGMTLPAHIPNPNDSPSPHSGSESGGSELSRETAERRQASRFSRVSLLREVIRHFRSRDSSQSLDRPLDISVGESLPPEVSVFPPSPTTPSQRPPWSIRTPSPVRQPPIGTPASLSSKFVESERRVHEYFSGSAYFFPPSQRGTNQQSSNSPIEESGSSTSTQSNNLLTQTTRTDPLLSASSDLNEASGSGQQGQSQERNRGEKRPLTRSNSDELEASTSGIPPKRVNTRSTDQSVEEQQNQNNLGMSRIQIQRRREGGGPSTTTNRNPGDYIDILLGIKQKMKKMASRTFGAGESSSANSTSSPAVLPPNETEPAESTNHQESSSNIAEPGPSSSNEERAQKKLVKTSKFPSNFSNPNRNCSEGESSRANDGDTNSEPLLNFCRPFKMFSSLRRSENSGSNTASEGESCARTNMPCSSANRTGFRSSSTYNPHQRRRLFSHRSAFYPPRVNSTNSGLPRAHRYRRNNICDNHSSRVRYSPTSRSNPSSGFNFDELINYSEMANAEGEGNRDPQPSQNSFHPFDPPPDFLSIHPENIGIGNMYSNIVQELESSLNDVRNIRASNRLGETSDMLSSFSDRLQSIMNQSHAILRNLGTTIDQITSNADGNSSQSPITTPTELDRSPQLSFNDRNFYVRDNSRNEGDGSDLNDPVATDHSYPMRNNQGGNSNVTPLMASLYLTVSHIQRQARLLRQQVESIERIDSAMLEVAQLQVIRHIFVELQHYFQNPNSQNNFRSPDNEAPSQEEPFRPQSRAEVRPEAEPDYLQPGIPQGPPNRGNRPYARCIFLMRARRTPSGNVLRRPPSRERLTRCHLRRRHCPVRLRSGRSPTEPDSSDNLAFTSHLDSNMPALLRRLELYLLEHARLMGTCIPNSNLGSNSTDVVEYLLTLRLNYCRMRALRLMGSGSSSRHAFSELRNETATVTREGRGRYAARQTLVSVADALLRFAEHQRNDPQAATSSSHLLEYIELSLLLSEILLLQIVDSIPPPTGMNLDSERESLSARINQMCSNMLQNRGSGQSQLTRSLRLMRMTVNHASHALDETYTARRNMLLPAGGDRARRIQLIREIHDCLRNIRRRGSLLTAISLNRLTLPVRERLRYANLDLATIRGHLPSSVLANESNTSSSTNTNQGGTNRSEASSDDSIASRLYRTNNVNLLGSDPLEDSTTRNNRPWDVPLVQVNDVPLNDNNYPNNYPPRPNHNRMREHARFTDRFDFPRHAHPFHRPRFLHPLYYSAMVNNPFDADLEDPPRDQIFEGDIITTIAPNHRIQMWKFSCSQIPNINNPMKNVVVSECKIHNDASVDIASDGSMLVTLLPSGGYLNITNRLGVYSLHWETLGQCLYITSLEHNAVSVSLSPLSRHLVVGLATRRISIIQNDKWTLARIFSLDTKSNKPTGRLSAIRQLEQNRDTNSLSVNCIRWLPISGQGLIYATNTGQLRVLT